MVTAVAVLTWLLTACTEDLPDVAGPGPHYRLPAHPEYQFLWRLGAAEPLPQHGYPSLGRRITDMDQLIEVAHFVTHQGCPSPQEVAPSQLDYYFTAGMFETFSATVVCDHGNGDVLALMKPGHEAQFESAYRVVPDAYKTRWREAARHVGRDCCDASKENVDRWAYHPVGVGNGFVVFKVLNAVGHPGRDDAWSYAGLARLVCQDEGRSKTVDLPLERHAASPGCYLGVRHR